MGKMPTGGNADLEICRLGRVTDWGKCQLGECRQNNQWTLGRRSRPGPLYTKKIESSSSSSTNRKYKKICEIGIVDQEILSNFWTGGLPKKFRFMGKAGVGSLGKNDRKIVFFAVFSYKFYSDIANSHHVLSSFSRRTRWHRLFYLILLHTPSKTRLKVLAPIQIRYQWESTV